MIKAIFLAAGQSKRIKYENKLVKRYKNIPLINHSLKVLHKSKVNKVIIVLGHQHKEVKKIIFKNKKNIFIYNKDYFIHWFNRYRRNYSKTFRIKRC